MATLIQTRELGKQKFGNWKDRKEVEVVEKGE
jgi:hypothetical protein